MASVAPAPPAASLAAPASFGRRLRVGVVADAPLQPRWLVEALARVAASDFSEIAWLAIENGTRFDFPAGKSNLAPFSWRVYRAVDRRLFGRGDWSRPVEVASAVPPARRDAQPEPVDVVVALGEVDQTFAESLATHGVWRYCFGRDHHACEGEAGIREVLDADDVTVSGLRVHLPGRGDYLAYQSWSRTMALSIARNRDNVFAKATEFLARALRELRSTGVVPGVEFVPGPNAAVSAPRTNPLPARIAKRMVEKITTLEQWTIAFRFADIEPWTGSLAGFHRLTPPDEGFWADPFPLQRNGKSYIFFEELPEGSDRAHISVIEVGRDGRASAPLRVLERDYHLSYPFLVEDQGQLYMVPESAANGTIEIYRCVDFPRKWRRERALVEGVFAADATLHRAGGRWWMFANIAANGAEVHDELHIFTSDALLGDWKPLERNPVKSDVRGARPAGRLFTQGGRLYRPAQICAPLYGSGIALQRVTRLADDYEEREERRIVPVDGEGVLGLHTINRAGDLSVIDTFVRRSRMRAAA